MVRLRLHSREFLSALQRIKSNCVQYASHCHGWQSDFSGELRHPGLSGLLCQRPAFLDRPRRGNVKGGNQISLMALPPAPRALGLLAPKKQKPGRRRPGSKQAISPRS